MTVSNEDIFNSIIKKENGVNPFLTVMNFTISFKTWLKFAKKRILIEKYARCSNKKDAYTELYDLSKIKMVKVDIEVEEIYSETSEEEKEPTSFKFSRKKTVRNCKFGDDHTPVKKKKDHLKLFGKKMSKQINI